MERALSDDCLRKVLTFVSVSDCARGAGAASKAMRGVASTTNRLRFTDKYVLRGDKHGVVHALATALGTRRWPTRAIRRTPHEPHGLEYAATPPARLGFTIHRVGGSVHAGTLREVEPYTSYVASATVDPGVRPDRRICGGGECRLRTGSWVQYEIPFQLQLTAFSLGVSSCYAETFVDWTFEAFDGEDWRPLLYAARAPEPYNREVFELMGAADFASARFRIRLDQPESESESEEDDDHDHACRCMHISGLELYGTIMPPWKID